ncbi:hypothetical protein D9M69_578950 [compost metagenome]
MIKRAVAKEIGKRVVEIHRRIYHFVPDIGAVLSGRKGEFVVDQPRYVGLLDGKARAAELQPQRTVGVAVISEVAMVSEGQINHALHLIGGVSGF